MKSNNAPRTSGSWGLCPQTPREREGKGRREGREEVRGRGGGRVGRVPPWLEILATPLAMGYAPRPPGKGKGKERGGGREGRR
jgi:hypothetical protein